MFYIGFSYSVIDPEIRNITASAGDDVLLDCEPPDGEALLISWNKDNDVVQITDAYRYVKVWWSSGYESLDSEPQGTRFESMSQH